MVIEVTTFTGNGEPRDTAYATTQENAVAAARTLIRDAADAGCASRTLLARFYVDGRMVREARMADL